MLLTVGMMKKALAEAPDDDALICSMNFGEDKLQTFSPKGYLVGHNDAGSKLFIIKNMGTHWTERWKKSFGNVKITEMIKRPK